MYSCRLFYPGSYLYFSWSFAGQQQFCFQCQFRQMYRYRGLRSRFNKVLSVFLCPRRGELESLLGIYEEIQWIIVRLYAVISGLQFQVNWCDDLLLLSGQRSFHTGVSRLTGSILIIPSPLSLKHYFVIVVTALLLPMHLFILDGTL